MVPFGYRVPQCDPEKGRTVWLQAALNSETVSKFSFELPPSLCLATCLFGTDAVDLKNMLCHITQTQASYASCGNEIIILYEGTQISKEMLIFSKWLSNKTTLTGQLEKPFN